MSYFDDRTDKDLSNPVHGQGTPGNDARRRSYELNDKYAGKDNTPSEENKPPEEDYSLNDDRRVKVLSPGTLVAKRFFRNRLAVVGLTILAVMFIFSFIGGLISPYGQDEVFYRDDIQLKEYAAMSENTEYRYLVADGQEFGTILQAQLTLHMGKDDSFSYKGVTYDVTEEGDSLYSVSSGGRLLAIAYKDIISANDPSQKFSFNFSFSALKAHANGETEFTADGKTYTLDEDSVMLNGEEIAYISRFVIQSKVSGTVISKDFKERVQQAVENGETKYTYVNDAGQEREIKLEYNPAKYQWSIKEGTSTRVFDAYSFPDSAHWLGTDKNGMDMLTRLMYGGRVSLMIGFIVVIISAALGVVLGGVSGYFGGWVDNLIMRIVDIFYCIPSTPLIIILGAAMDGMRVDPQIRMLYLMLILGFLGWPGIARLVRGQILSLREQEFMTATEACGISVSRRIFRHLIPNVIPQLIVNCTMSLGSTIITEATLSFLGLGVKFPFASWGNIMNDVSNSYVLTSYWFIWIPAGICLMLTVLGFNFVGDGLRDAFDPKMKR
jgi:peptide/nickel transport system permease protein